MGISNRVFCNDGIHPLNCMATHYKRRLSLPPISILSFGRQKFHIRTKLKLDKYIHRTYAKWNQWR